jgi:eukaryotic-like serine/threonine-protein kinase
MSEPPRSAKSVQSQTLQVSETVRDLTGLTLGDFQVERMLGSGGMGEVYLARQASLDRPVALKVLRPDMLSNPTYLARFESEAWAAAKLNHPNIVHIYTLGCVDNIRFIAMEYVPGTNLREYMNKRGVPDLPLALSIMKQAAQGVGAAGEVGMVHRDIKPENLLLTRKGQVKVADFGLCRTPQAEQLNLTQPGVTLGTPLYMSPEQVQGHAMDHRSDLYSLGVTFYHMLAGVPPFRADTGLAVALKHVRESPVSLAVHRPDLPAELVALVMKLLEKAPADRYQSAAELLRDLAKVREALHAPSGTVPATEAATIPPAAPAEPPRPRRSLPGLRLGTGTFAAVAAAGLAVGALLGWRARADDLLGPGAPPPHGAPGLWMAHWRAVPRARTAEGQYHYAQTRAADADEATWLAVPGYFPQEHQWAHRAYAQLARHLLRHNDPAALEALAADLERSTRDLDKSLATVARAAAAALRDDAQEVHGKLGHLPTTTLDPALAELALEAIARARNDATITATDQAALNRLRHALLGALGVEFLDHPNLTQWLRQD